MSALERLAMQHPHGPTGNGGGGGKDRLTGLDVAAAEALGGLQGGPYLLAHAIVAYRRLRAGERPAPELRQWTSAWVRIVRAWGERERWDAPDYLVTRLGLLTAVDAVGGGQRCDKCKGAGVHANQKACAACEGSGNAIPTARHMATRMECRPTVWRDVWDGRYARAMAVLAIWESDAERIIARAMRAG